jgi:hypothetical protein
MRLCDVLNVSGRVLQILDLQGIHHEPQFFHLHAAGTADLRTELVPLADNLLHGHAADDGAQVALKDVVYLAFHFGLLAQEPPRRIRDKGRRIANLVNDHTFHNHLDALGGNAGNLELGFVQGERQGAHRLEAGKDQRPFTRDDFEIHACPRFKGATGQPGNNEGFIGFRHLPHQFCCGPNKANGKNHTKDDGNKREECCEIRHNQVLSKVRNRHCGKTPINAAVHSAGQIPVIPACRASCCRQSGCAPFKSPESGSYLPVATRWTHDDGTWLVSPGGRCGLECSTSLPHPGCRPGPSDEGASSCLAEPLTDRADDAAGVRAAETGVPRAFLLPRVLRQFRW